MKCDICKKKLNKENVFNFTKVDTTDISNIKYGTIALCGKCRCNLTGDQFKEFSTYSHSDMSHPSTIL